MTGIFLRLRALARCEHPEDRHALVPGLVRCLDCGAAKTSARGEWVRTALVEQLLDDSLVQTLCGLDDEQFVKFMAGSEAVAERMATTENAATFAWAAQQAGGKADEETSGLVSEPSPPGRPVGHELPKPRRVPPVPE